MFGHLTDKSFYVAANRSSRFDQVAVLDAA